MLFHFCPSIENCDNRRPDSRSNGNAAGGPEEAGIAFSPEALDAVRYKL